MTKTKCENKTRKMNSQNIGKKKKIVSTQYSEFTFVVNVFINRECFVLGLIQFGLGFGVGFGSGSEEEKNLIFGQRKI